MKLYNIFKSSQARVLDFLLENKDDEFFFTDIAKKSHTDPRTLKKYFKNWLKEEIIIQKKEKYKINKRSLIVKALLLFKEEEKNLKTRNLWDVC